MGEEQQAAGTSQSWLATVLSHHVAVVALATALGAAIQPALTALEAWRKDVKASELALVRESEAVWARNLACIAIGSTWEIDGPRQLTIKITVCPETGDLLVRYFANEWSPTYKWLRAPDTGTPTASR